MNYKVAAGPKRTIFIKKNYTFCTFGIIWIHILSQHLSALTLGISTITGFRTSLPATSANLIQNPLCSEYASVDIQNINHYRSLQPPCVPVTATPPTATPASYNLGHYFPRVASEPPSRKSYQTSNRNGDPLKVKKDRQFQNYTKFDKSFSQRLITFFLRKK